MSYTPGHEYKLPKAPQIQIEVTQDYKKEIQQMNDINMNENNNAQDAAAGQTAQQGQQNQQEDAGQQPRTFTQEDVDKIVENRLARERRRFSSVISGRDPRELELEERENAVRKREMQVTARAMLSEHGLHDDALELLNYEDEDKLQKSVELLKSIIDNSTRSQVDKVLRGGRPIKKAPEPEYHRNNGLRDAFGLFR